MKPLGQIYVHGVSKVHDLLMPNSKEWNESLIDDMFSPEDANDIAQIAVGGPNMGDYIAWNYTKTGQFTVRSSYHLRMTLNGVKTEWPGPSSSVHKHKGWLGLWDFSAPNKAKIHMWRVMQNGLAMGAELLRQCIKPGVFCTASGRE